jgi:hypothetical protein
MCSNIRRFLAPLLAVFVAFAGFDAPAQSINPQFIQSGTGAKPRTLQDKARDVISIKDYQTGTSCDAAFGAAIAYAATVGGEVLIPTGTCSITNNRTIASNVALRVQRGGAVDVDVSKTLTVKGEIIAPSTSQIFIGSGIVLIVPPPSQVIHALWFTGKDIGAKINAAVKAVGSGAATINVGAGGYAFATQIDLTNSSGIRLTSDRGSANSTGNIATTLTWTGGAGSGSAIKAPGSRAFEFDHLMLTYNNASYNGNLLSLSSAGGLINTTGAHIHHARIGGQAGATSAARLIELNTTLNFTIDNTSMSYAAVGIGASGGSNNVISIGDGMWFDSTFTDAAVRAWGSAWRFGNFVAESSPDSGVPLTTFFKIAPSGGVTGLSFNGGMFVDGRNGGGTLIDLSGGISAGISIHGVMASAASGTFLKASATSGATSGLSASGNIVTGMATAFDLGKAYGVTLTGNSIRDLTTPWTGAEPINVLVAANDTDRTSSSGVTVANNADIAISIPGSPNAGAGLLVVWIQQESGTCLISLNGSAGTASKIADTFTSCDVAKNTGSRANIYWDAGSKTYRLQNKLGGARTFSYQYLGR